MFTKCSHLLFERRYNVKRSRSLSAVWRPVGQPVPTAISVADVLFPPIRCPMATSSRRSAHARHPDGDAVRRRQPIEQAAVHRSPVLVRALVGQTGASQADAKELARAARTSFLKKCVGG
jgi:hypothetical protein